MNAYGTLEQPIISLDRIPSSNNDGDLTDALENGAIVTLKDLKFSLSDAERSLLNPRILGKSKNVSFTPSSEALGGTVCTGEEAKVLRMLMARYSRLAADIVSTLFPSYAGRLKVMRTSLRPAEISGRVSSWRKDDSRLHVDAFPSQPTHGDRILRVFRNVNQVGRPRVWRIGEPFESVARRFLNRIGRPVPGAARLMHLLGVTKSVRSEYDHVMLGLHDAMKADDAYQRSVGQSPIHFEPGTTWICFADSVSHAAVSGQHQFEQTIVIPLGAMRDEGRSPLRILERLRNRRLA